MNDAMEIYEAEEAIIETTTMVAALAKGEVESQLDAAHKYPRKLRRFLDESMSMVSTSPEIASMCFYSVPRDGKQIKGPSVRMAEIVASCYGNMHVAARTLDVGANDRECVSQGVAWDLEKNLRVSVEKRRRITKKDGSRFSDDMIITTQNAAASIALRDAVFRVVPRAYIETIYNRARSIAAGDAKSLPQKRDELFKKLADMGATKDRILAKIQRPDMESVTMDDVADLIAMGTAVSDGMCKIDEQFPSLEPTKADAVSELKTKLAAKNAKNETAVTE